MDPDRGLGVREPGSHSGGRLVAASSRLDEIERYITGLFDAFNRIESHGVAPRPVPAEFGVQGFFFRDERHFVYWRRLSNPDIGIVTILRERMHQIERLRDNSFGEQAPAAGAADS